MKGLIFTEFLEMVEVKFSFEVADNIITAANLPSGGVYTALGNYEHTEMLELVTHLSRETGLPIPDLVEAFGNYLFSRFVETYPIFFEGITGAFDFLRRIEHYIHVEVLKLYPHAELPTFHYEASPDNQLIMIYESSRPFSDLAKGLIEGCFAYYQEPATIELEDISTGDKTRVRFIITKWPL